MPNPFITFETQVSDPIHTDGKSIKLYSRALVLRLPGSSGLIWNRPVSVNVRSTDGKDETLAVHDTTRLVQLAMLGAAFFVFLFTRVARRSRS